MRWNNFTYLVKHGIHSIWKNKLMSFASFSIILVSLLMTCVSVLTMLNINIIIGNVEKRNEIIVFMDRETTKEILDLTENRLKETANVTQVRFHSKEAALEEYKSNYSDYAVIFEEMHGNPMPDSFIVKIDDLTIITNTVDTIKKLGNVESVSAPFDFARFLVDMRATLTAIFGFLLFALVVVSLVIISNTVRTSVFARRREINIMKYVGATNTFIRTPFFVEGMVIGILAGVLSWYLTSLSYQSVMGLFSENLTLWTTFGIIDVIKFDDISLLVLGINCLAGAFLSAFGTLISMGKHLKV